MLSQGHFAPDVGWHFQVLREMGDFKELSEVVSRNRKYEEQERN